MQWIIAPLGKLFGIGENLTKPEQYTIKRMKRLEYNVEAGRQYVGVVEGTGEYAGMPRKRRDSWMLHWRKRLFDSA